MMTPAQAGPCGGYPGRIMTTPTPDPTPTAPDPAAAPAEPPTSEAVSPPKKPFPGRSGVRSAARLDDWPERFLTALASLGNVSRACKTAKVGRQTAYDKKAADPEFSARWDEAQVIADELMEGEARRRAVEGVLKPVYQSGKLVGKVREYSDSLLQFLLRGHNPAKFCDNSRVVLAGDASAPIKTEHSGKVAVELSGMTNEELDEYAAKLRAEVAAAGESSHDDPKPDDDAGTA
jgi:hypothetical protein